MRKTMLGLTMLALLGGTTAVVAAPRGEGGDPALRQVQAQMQKLAAERTALQKENAGLSAKLAEQDKRIQALEAEVKQRSGELDKAQGANEQLRARVERDNVRYKDLSERNSQTNVTLRDAQSDIQLLHNAVQEREHWISECQTRNDKLFQANTELLAAYRDKGAWDALKQSDPVTGLGAIAVENAVQEYQFRLEDLRTVKFEPENGAQSVQAR